MTSVLRTLDLPVSAAEVWKLIGGFNALTAWHPAVAASSLDPVGEVVRRLELVGGGEITEKLVRLDDAGWTYSYTIEESPLPVSGYLATLSVHGDGPRCSVRWSSEFEPVGVSEAEAQGIIAGIYEAGFDRLREVFGA